MNGESTGPLRPLTTEPTKVTEKRSGGLAASERVIPALKEEIHHPAIPIEAVDSIEVLYDLGRTIGRGEFAKVKLARCRSTQLLVPRKRAGSSS